MELTNRPTVLISMVHCEQAARTKNKVESANNIPEYKVKKTKKDLSKEHDEATTENGQTLVINWKKQLSLNDKSNEFRQELEAMMFEYQT